LPLALLPGAADYGLVFIAPIGSHYALVNSGLPWWTGADEARRGGDPFLPEQYRLLTTFGDYILFKGSLANVIAQARFDRNGKLPPDAPARMLATGTITTNNQCPPTNPDNMATGPSTGYPTPSLTPKSIPSFRVPSPVNCPTHCLPAARSRASRWR